MDAVGGAAVEGGYAVVCSSGGLLLVMSGAPVKVEGERLLVEGIVVGESDWSVVLNRLEVLDPDEGKPTLTSPTVTEVVSPEQNSTIISVVSP